MTPGRASVRVLRAAILLAALFNVLALVVMIRNMPIAFALFMFIGQPLVVVAIVLMVGAVLADLRARQIL